MVDQEVFNSGNLFLLNNNSAEAELVNVGQ